MTYMYGSPLDLGSINSKTEETISEAEAMFNIYIDNIIDIGEYNDWHSEFVLNSHEFGELFKKYNPAKFIKILNDKIELSNKKEQEVLRFLLGLIKFNFDTFIIKKEYFSKCIDEYPYNPEFYFLLANTVFDESDYANDIDKSLFMYEQGIKLNPKCINNVTGEYLAKIVDKINFLIKEKDYTAAQNITEKIIKENKIIKNDPHFNNIVYLTEVRIKDNIMFDENIKESKEEINQYLKHELSSEKKRMIELLGIFTAIMAFIFSSVTVSTTSNISIGNSLVFVISLGLVLILFSTILSFISREKFTWLSDIRFFIVLINSLLLTFIIVKYA